MTDKHPDLLERIRLRLDDSFVASAPASPSCPPPTPPSSSTTCGILGTVGFLRISVWSAFAPTYGPHWLLVAITVFLSLVGVVLWGTLAGSMLPIALKRAGLDPAVSSAPFVATLVDVTGIVIYFEVAARVLRGTLL